MTTRLKTGFVGGFLGALLLAALMYALYGAGLLGPPGFVGNYRAAFEPGAPLGHVFATLLFAVSGGVWGLVYGALAKRSTPLKGMAFAFLPTLWFWIVVAGIMGSPLFGGFTAKGLLLPVLFNVVLWGSFLGWYGARRSSSGF